MGQFSVEIWHPTGSLLGGIQQLTQKDAAPHHSGGWIGYPRSPFALLGAPNAFILEAGNS